MGPDTPYSNRTGLLTWVHITGSTWIRCRLRALRAGHGTAWRPRSGCLSAGSCPCPPEETSATRFVSAGSRRGGILRDAFCCCKRTKEKTLPFWQISRRTQKETRIRLTLGSECSHPVYYTIRKGGLFPHPQISAICCSRSPRRHGARRNTNNMGSLLKKNMCVCVCVCVWVCACVRACILPTKKKTITKSDRVRDRENSMWGCPPRPVPVFLFL